MALAYYGAAKLGLWLNLATGQGTPVWPAAGVALAGTLVFGYRMSAGIFLGAIAISVSTAVGGRTSAASVFATSVLSTSIGLGVTLQAIVGAFLIRRFVGLRTNFLESRQIIIFLLLGGPVSVC